MENKNNFFLIAAATVIIIRAGIFLMPEKNITILDLIIHHFWIGIILLIISRSIPKKIKLKLVLFSISIGMISDQLVFMILGAGYDKEYWSLPSILGTIIVLMIIFLFRKRILQEMTLDNIYKQKDQNKL